MGYWVIFDDFIVLKVAHCKHKSDHGAIDCGGSCAAISLDDIAVYKDGEIAQFFKVNAISEAATYESLDLYGASGLLASCGFSVTACVCGSR